MSTTTNTSDARDEIDATPGDPFEPVAGWLHLSEQRAGEPSNDAYSRALVKFYAEPLPFLAEVDREGECRLLTFENGFCDPFCEWEEVCIDGACVPFPLGLDVGTITITGPETTVFAPLPDSGNFYATDEHPDDLFVAGEDLVVSATGGDLAAFELRAKGPVTLDSSLRTDEGRFPVIRDDADFTVTWTPAEPASRVRLSLHPHGPHGIVEAAVIECDSPDDGSITVDARLLPGFFVGWGGCGECPGSYLTRYHRDVATVAGKRIELIVGSQLEFWLEYQGE